MLWLFERVIKGPAIQLLPDGWQRRLQDKLAPLSFRGWSQFGRIVFWIAVGTLTHLVWDQFTHPYTRMGMWWPLLRTYVAVPFRHPMTVAGVLQDTSTILGFLILCLWCAAWYQRTPPAAETLKPELAPLTRLCVVLMMGLVAIVGGYLLASYALTDRVGNLSRATRVAITLITMIQGFCVAMLTYAAAMTWRGRLQSSAAPQINESPR